MVKQIPQQDKTTPPEAFAVIPSDLIRDPNLSATAKAAYCLIDDRQGNRPYVRVSLTVLATDLKAHRSTVQRAFDELETAGWLVRQTTGRTNAYSTINSARNRRVMWQIVTSRGLRCDKSRLSDVANSDCLQSNNSLGVKKQASNSAEPAAAALVSPSGSPQATTLDAFIERFIGMSDLGLERNRRTSAAWSAAMSNGWQPEALAVALRDMKRSANAGTGVIVGDLEKLAGNLPNLTMPASTAAPTESLHLIHIDTLKEYLRPYGVKVTAGAGLTRSDADKAPECKPHGECQWLCPTCRMQRTDLAIAWLDDLVTKTGATLTAIGIYTDKRYDNTARSETALEATYTLTEIEYTAYLRVDSFITGSGSVEVDSYSIYGGRLGDYLYKALGFDSFEAWVQWLNANTAANTALRSIGEQYARDFELRVDAGIRMMPIRAAALSDLVPDAFMQFHKTMPAYESAVTEWRATYAAALNAVA